MSSLYLNMQQQSVVISIYTCIHLSTALSVAKVREVLQGLDLETIGRHVLDIPKSRLEELTDGATTKEQKEVVLIRYWLLHHPLISWRLLIARLDNMGSHDRADQIRHLAEALTGKIQCHHYHA